MSSHHGGVTQVSLAAEYQCGQATISHALHDSWRWLDEDDDQPF